MADWTDGGNEKQLAYEKSPEEYNPSHRQKLVVKKQRLTVELDRVNAAIAALDAHPDLEEFIKTLGRAGV